MARVDPRNFYLVEEQSYKILKESEGDEAYLQRLIGGNLVSLSTLHFRRSDPPLFLESSPIYEATKEYPRGFPQLQYGRQFLIRRQFELWAAVYKYRNSQEFVSPEAGVAIGRVVSKSCRESLRKAYSSDLYIQKEVERLRRIYGKDHSEVIAGLTGAEVIAYMDDNLPEPDPRALIKSGSGSASPSNLTKRPDPDSSGIGSGSGEDGRAGEKPDWSGWLWFVCAVTSAGLAAAWYLRRRG